ncbi:MAG: hypothetical protein V7727_20585 [Sneathiella sp.]
MTIKHILIVMAVLIVMIVLAGMYKFNYLAGLPDYDVDGNPMPKVESTND